MVHPKLWFGSVVCTLALAVACSKSSPNPTAPTREIVKAETAAPDGSTLKVSAPTPQSPINGAKGAQGVPITLIIGNSTQAFGVTPVVLTYKFEVYNSAGAKVYTSPNVVAGTSTTSNVVTVTLEGEKTYTWQARAEFQGASGPWSTRASFVSPTNDGYIRGNEIYDPLMNGKTVGDVHGAAEFVPGVGLHILSEETFVEYNLPATLTEGSISALITGVGVTSSTEDPKLRVFTMRQGTSAINDNPYRMSVDKRGNGAVAFRFLTNEDNYVETQGAERRVVPFHESLTYFVQATWRDSFFNVEYREGGVNGTTIYSFGKGYDGVYSPSPHNVYIGSPYAAGDRGEPSSLDGMIIRQLWVSPRDRPDYANK